MKKIKLKHFGKTVTVEFQEETDLTEVLHTLTGLVKALGYEFDGHLTIEDIADKHDSSDEST